MDYLVNGLEYRLSYRELREQYLEFCRLSDEEFMSRLPAAIHLACVIGYLKEINTTEALSDKGIIHELVHLLHIPLEKSVCVAEIRKKFQVILELS